MNDEMLIRIRTRRAAAGGNVWWLNGDTIDCWSYPTAEGANHRRAKLIAAGHTVYEGQFHPVNGGLLTD
jgi:hypothetical protein